MLDKVTQLLLVEDDEDDYILTRDYLEQLDSHTFNIEWISSPEQAISMLSKNEHDICLLDYRLGASNGLDVLKEAIDEGVEVYCYSVEMSQEALIMKRELPLVMPGNT